MSAMFQVENKITPLALTKYYFVLVCLGSIQNTQLPTECTIWTEE